MGEIARQKRYQQIKEFLDGRVIRNQDYFKSNTKIVGVYKFHKKVVDNLRRCEFFSVNSDLL